jgi:phage-related protein
VLTTTIVFFRDEDGGAPFLDWFDRLPEKAKVQCRARLELLAEQGHQLRRPAADYLRDGIYELRAKAGRVQYRMLYFFHGRQVVVISHGITKQEAAVPPTEIERARRRKRVFEADPPRHTHKETL